MVFSMVLFAILVIILLLIILADMLGLYGDENENRDWALIISFSILGIIAILLTIFVI